MSSRTAAEKIVQKMIYQAARSEWDKIFKSIPANVDIEEISDVAASLSVIAAEVSEYADLRGANGCGDAGHETAMKAVQMIRNKVRKALGFLCS